MAILMSQCVRTRLVKSKSEKGDRKEVGEGTIIEVELRLGNCFHSVNKEGSSHEISLEWYYSLL